jgi:hypothetical protein
LAERLVPFPAPPTRLPPHSNRRSNKVNGEYRCRDEKLQPLLREVLRLLKRFDSAQVRHVYR